MRAEFGALEPGRRVRAVAVVAGRISGRRGHGKAIFLDLTDRTGRLQLHATLDVLGEDGLAAVADSDLGDVVAVHGEVFSSRRGEGEAGACASGGRSPSACARCPRSSTACRT